MGKKGELGQFVEIDDAAILAMRDAGILVQANVIGCPIIGANCFVFKDPVAAPVIFTVETEK